MSNFYSQPPPPPPPAAGAGSSTGFYNPAASNPYGAPPPAPAATSSSTDWYTPTPPPAPAVSTESSSNPYARPSASTSTNTNTSSAIPAAPASLGAVEKAQLSGAMSQLPSGPMNSNATTTTTSPPSGGAIGPIGGGSTNTSNSNLKPSSGYDPTEFENEPPLLEELGIHLPHILAKSKVVLLPIGRVTSSIDTSLMDDDDLAGPLAIALLLGGELLLTAKLHFGYIYGFGLSGWLAMTLIINLMSPQSTPTSAWSVMSILGYCLLPVNLLAALNVFYRLKHGGVVGMVLAGVTILWCTVASTRLFERSCEMRSQRYLIAYPASLLYSCFVMITIF